MDDIVLSYVKKIEELGLRIPMCLKEIHKELDLSQTSWYKIRKGICQEPRASTVRAMKRFIQKYKDQ